MCAGWFRPARAAVRAVPSIVVFLVVDPFLPIRRRSGGRFPSGRGWPAPLGARLPVRVRLNLVGDLLDLDHVVDQLAAGSISLQLALSALCGLPGDTKPSNSAIAARLSLNVACRSTPAAQYRTSQKSATHRLWYADGKTCDLHLKIEAPPRHLAGVISRQTSSANVRPHGVDRARRGDAYVSHKRRTATTAASHASQVAIDIRMGDSVEIGAAFQ
jgi:hypothetical protein